MEALGKEERRAVAAKHLGGGKILLRDALRGVVERLNERNAAAEIQKVAWQLGKHEQLLRKYGTTYQSKIRNLERAPTVYSNEMLAGNVLPEIYVALTGNRPTVYVKGVAAHFVLTVMHELRIEYTAEGVVKAMQRYKVAEQYRARFGAKKALRTTRTNK